MIKIDNLSKKYSNNNILSDINLQLHENNIYFIMGKNGSGKTTLIKCLLDLERYEGNITYEEKSFQFLQHKSFVIFDDIPLYNNLNGFENIKFMLSTATPFNKNDIIALGILTEKS